MRRGRRKGKQKKTLRRRFAEAAETLTGRAQKPKPGEVAVVASAFGPSPWGIDLGEVVQNPDRVLRAKGSRYSYDLYEEIQDLDPDVAHALEERVQAVVGLDSTIEPYDETDDAALVQDFCVAAIRALPNWREGRRGLQEGSYVTGRGIVEIIWGPFRYVRPAEVVTKHDAATGKETVVSTRPEYVLDGWAPVDLKWRDPRYFYHRKVDGALLYDRLAGGLEQAVPVADRKFLVLPFGGRYGNKYGYSILGPLYLAYWFKKANLKYAGIFNERHAVPTPLAIAYEQWGFTEEQMEEICEAIQVDSSAVITLGDRVPTDNEGRPALHVDDFIKFLEADKSGATTTYETYHRTCKDMVLERLKGTALMTTSGERGSYGLGRAQIDSTWVPTVEDEVARLEQIISDDLLRWMVDVNFGVNVPGPRWICDLDEPSDLNAKSEYYERVVGTLQKLEGPDEGIPLSLRQLREDLGLREPDGPEDTVRIKKPAPPPAFGGGFGGPPGLPGKGDDDEGDDEPPVKTSEGRAARTVRLADVTPPPAETKTTETLIEEGRAAYTARFRSMNEGIFAYAKKKSAGTGWPLDAAEVESDWRPDDPRTERKIAAIANSLTAIWTTLWLLGRYQIESLMPDAEAAVAMAARTGVERAADTLAGQLGLTKVEYDALSAELKTRAWYVSRLQSEWAIDEVKTAVSTAIADGTGRAGFLDDLERRFTWHDADGNVVEKMYPWHAEVVYDNNAHTTYNAARQTTMELPHVQEFFPMWEYVNPWDSRTSPICLAFRNVRLPSNDPRWKWMHPLNHDRCRSKVRPVSKYEVDELGLEPVGFTLPEGVAVSERFMTNPAAFLGMEATA